MDRSTFDRDPAAGITARGVVWAVILAIGAAGAVLVWVRHFQRVDLHHRAVQAATAGGLHRLTRMLDEGLDVNAPPETRENSPRDTLLMIAARVGDEEAVLMLLERSADVDARNRRGETALMHAIMAGRPAIIERLLAAGADPLAQTLNGRTTLVVAAGAGSIVAMETLLDHGVEVSEPGANGSTALHQACGRGVDWPVVEFLLQAGAEVDALNGRDLTPLMETATALRWQPFDQDEGSRQVRKTAMLLEAGADVSLADSRGETALFAAACSSADILELLLTAGADPVVVDRSGRSPLHQAVERGPARAVKLLLEAGADPALAATYWGTPAEIAVHRRGPEGKEIRKMLEEAIDGTDEE